MGKDEMIRNWKAWKRMGECENEGFWANYLHDTSVVILYVDGDTHCNIDIFIDGKFLHMF